MSEKTRKQDRRTRYTRQTIKDTFLELLKQKSFTKISVTVIFVKSFCFNNSKKVSFMVCLVYLVRRSCFLVFSDIMSSIECMLYNVSFLNSFWDVLRNRTDFID